jgi:hypothetical protein
MGKIINCQFATISGNGKQYFSSTTLFDVVRFTFGLMLIAWLISDIIVSTFQVKNRSIIFEIGMFVIGKLEMIQPLVVMWQVFIFRHEYFNIHNDLDWIDEKVRIIN